ncbi:MAG: 50S ribosomal protein L17 [Tepidisphaerales bacterium]
MSRHLIRGRQLSRDTEHRKALRRNLVQSLFEHGKIRTTLPKAKEVKAFAEKLITLAKTGLAADTAGQVRARRRVVQALCDRRLVDENYEFITDGPVKTVVQKLFAEIAPKFKGRAGGYTRIIKTSDFRIGDGGDIVVLQLVTEQAAPKGTARRSAGLRRKKAEKRKAFAAKVFAAAK